ncbi:MAG: hypothetical protein U9Q92_07675, partial [archaeon]|nr:hypothetical protein [archaeon]
MGKYGVLAGRDKKLLSFVSVVFFVFICLCSGSVFASHNSSAELQPEWSSSGQNTEYAVTVMNSLGSDPIDEVRIFRALNYTNFDCKNKTGWELLEDITWYDPDLGGFTKMCWYYTLNSSNNIPAGGDEVFEFSATVPLSGCNHKWKFETRDEESSGSGDWRMIFANTSVDDDAPNVTKTINGAQSGSCPPGSGEECWIRQDTEIQIDIMEAGLCGVSGLDFCEVTYTLDGSAPIPVVYVEFNETPLTTSWNYSMTFDNDSLHVLNVTCKDIAGNILEDIEKFRVDDTPPETTKTYGNPHFPYTINNTQYPHWITTHTPITLAANDPDPTGHGCNISNMTTYYRNVYEGPHGLPGFCENYNVCMTWQPSAWDACGWIEYTVPFFKNEESCHIIEYYSVDELGNREPVKHQCVFVEDTPPTADKIIGEPKIPCNANMENNHIVAAQAGVQGVSPVTLYVIADNSKQPNLLEAYNVEANGTLTYVSNYTLPTVG